jgi:ribosomal protein L11 methyltransferase
MQWIEISATLNSREAESVALILGQYGQGGATIEEWASGDNDNVNFTVRAYLPRSRSYQAVRQKIAGEISRLPYPVNLVERVLKPEDWMDSLKKHFGILEIGDSFIIKPTWIFQTLPLSTRIIIELDPGAAFGTGLHPTTRLCLLGLEKYFKRGMTVLDMGTGSGILAIAAAKLGASSILGLDIDPVAVKAACSNIKTNRVDQLVRIKRGSLSLEAQRKLKNCFDLILANITARTVIDLAFPFVKVLKPGGILIVSGIQKQQLDEVLISLALAGFKFKAVDYEEEWSTVVASKEGS